MASVVSKPYISVYSEEELVNTLSLNQIERMSQPWEFGQLDPVLYALNQKVEEQLSMLISPLTQGKLHSLSVTRHGEGRTAGFTVTLVIDYPGDDQSPKTS